MSSDRVFLDSNVLFSAAHHAESGLRRLWALDHVELVTSAYATEEGRRNLEAGEAVRRLNHLIRTVESVPEQSSFQFTEDPGLPEKDRPILAAAVAAQATHLLTGDIRHFGHLFGTYSNSVLILRPAEYLRGRGH